MPDLEAALALDEKMGAKELAEARKRVTLSPQPSTLNPKP